jgi:poly(A) polymerase
VLDVAPDPRLFRQLMAESRPIMELSEIFVAAGHDFVLAGGAVRDSLLGSGVSDFDVSTDASPDAIRRLVSGWAEKVWLAGNEVGTVSCSRGDTSADITPYRRLPEDLGLGGLDGDLSYRDFRINAMSVFLPSFEFHDPFGGAADLEARVLQTPRPARETLLDRPVRMIRVARFAARLGFTPTEELLAAMAELAPTIRQADPYWLAYEIRELNDLPNRDRGMEILVDTGVTDQLPSTIRFTTDRSTSPHSVRLYAP